MHMLLHPSAAAPFTNEIKSPDATHPYAKILNTSVSSTPTWLKACNPKDRIVIRCADLSDPAQTGQAETDQAARLLASWSQSGWDTFDSQLLDLDAQANAADIQLLIRPNAQGMLSDAICTMSWARRSESLPNCKLLLDPLGWLTPSMLKDAPDHLARINDLCLGCNKIDSLLIRSLKANDSGSLSQTSLTVGDLDPTMILDQLAGLIDSINPIILLNQADSDLFDS